VAGALESGADIALWTSGEHPDTALDRPAAETSRGRLPMTETDAAVAPVLAMKHLCGAVAHRADP
jgi:hypothetical protein